MIVESNGRQHTLLLDMGHGEYGVPKDQFGAKVRYLIMPEEGPPEVAVEFGQWFARAKQSPNNRLDDDDAEWTTLMLITADWEDLVACFRMLATNLMPSLDPAGYTPGGDDDYYDYYPSGMRLLREFALDMDELWAKNKGPGTHYDKPGFLGVYMNVAADFLRREAARWEPNYISCGNVGYDDFFASEEIEVYVGQLCKFHALKNKPSGWEVLGKLIGLPQRAYVRWNTPTDEQRAYMERMGSAWDPKYTEEQPYKEAPNAG